MFSFFRHYREPKGLAGRLFLFFMDRAHRKMWRKALRGVSLADGTSILDVGCGRGGALREMLRMFPGAAGTGVDISEESLRAARAAVGHGGKRCHFLKGEAGALPCSDGSMDLVTAFETVYFWPDLLQGLKECGRVLTPGGWLVLSLAAAGRNNGVLRAAGAVEIPSAAEMKQAMEAAGFAVVSVMPAGRKGFILRGQKQ